MKNLKRCKGIYFPKKGYLTINPMTLLRFCQGRFKVPVDKFETMFIGDFMLDQ